MWFKVRINDDKLQIVQDISREIRTDFYELFRNTEKEILSELSAEIFNKNIRANFVFRRLNLPAFILECDDDNLVMFAKDAKAIFVMRFRNQGYYYFEVDEDKALAAFRKREGYSPILLSTS